MAEDWRVTVTVDGAETGPLLQSLHEREVRNELRDELGGRVAVSSDGPHIFLYASTRAAGETAQTELREALAEHGLDGEPKLDRWHPIEERWEDADVPLPSDEAGRELEERRREEADALTPVAEWEVRVELESHHQAVALAEELEGEGLSIVRRWRYLLVGTTTEDEANALAERLRAEAPKGAKVQVEPGLGIVWELMPRNPYAVFGGLGA
jgi:hypothetical protein